MIAKSTNADLSMGRERTLPGLYKRSADPRSGSDAFHRVPAIPAFKWGAVERVPTRTRARRMFTGAQAHSNRQVLGPRALMVSATGRTGEAGSN